MSDLNILPDPVETADLAVSFGETNVVRFSKRLMEWMALLFPVGAGSWTTFTPTLTDISLGTGGSNVARYTQTGKKVCAHYEITLGSGFTLGAAPAITLPTAARSAFVIGTGRCRPNPTLAEYAITIGSTSTTVVRPRVIGTNGVLSGFTASSPGTWVAGGWIILDVEYEVP